MELHSEFRDRWITFHLADGTVRDSREINWRRVEWERVVKLEVNIRGHRHTVTAAHPGFAFFLNFKVCRVEGSTRRTWWVVGWADGRLAHLRAIDFKTGEEAARYTQPIETLAAHIHPRVQHLRAAQVRGTRTPEELGY